MRRRSPPSSLILFQGPLPPRSQPKHTLPTLPCPAFHPEGHLRRSPVPVPRTRHHTPSSLDINLIPLSLELAAICRPGSSVTSLSDTGADSPTSSPVSATKKLREPWVPTSVGVVVDVDGLLAWPKPVAIGV